MQNELTVGLAIRQFIVGIGDRDERLVFLAKIQGETSDERVHGYCDELRDYLEGDSDQDENVPCGTKREISLDREDEEGSDEDHDAEYDDLPLSYYGYQGDELA